MAVEVTFQDKAARDFLKRTLKRYRDVATADRNYATALSAVVFRDIMQHFSDERGPDGAWHPWSQAYQAHMEKRGKAGNKILQDTGRLRQSFTPQNWRQVSEGILWFNAARTSTGFPYAAAHDRGGPVLPKRPFMWLGRDAKETMGRVTLDFITQEKA